MNKSLMPPWVSWHDCSRTEIANDEKWPATSEQGPNGEARLRKYKVVKVPRSVYAAIPGM
jgi:hypothetical protein